MHKTVSEDCSALACHPLCETATSFVNIEMTGEMDPKRPGVGKVLHTFQMDIQTLKAYLCYLSRGFVEG